MKFNISKFDLTQNQTTHQLNRQHCTSSAGQPSLVNFVGQTFERIFEILGKFSLRFRFRIFRISTHLLSKFGYCLALTRLQSTDQTVSGMGGGRIMEDYADFLKWKKASMKALDRAVSGQHDEKVEAEY
ncbi:hypothetical protein T02_10802 [Trichinella nativa]|uniref:Uncharacterized protein n=1 Tax=Trichinella nativa TaxID=6335 RepID=A0A0V1LGC5_9BILA|nr:hypothetical protein T02_10802 [Trichinella nativa]